MFISLNRTARHIMVAGMLASLLAGCGQEQASKSERLEKAVEYRQQNDLRASVIELKNLLQQSPNNAEARWQLGLTYLAQQNGAQAETELLRARQLGKESSRLSIALARSHVLQGQYDNALELLNDVDADDQPDLRTEALLVRGLALLGKEKPQEASSLFEQVRAIEPGSVEATLGMAWSEQRQGNLDAAGEYVTQVLQQTPDHVGALRIYGDIGRARGDLAASDDAYSQAIDATRKPFDLHRRRAMVRLELDDLAGAETDVAAMRRMDAKHPITHYISGVLHFRQQRYNDAQVDFEAVLSRLPDHPSSTYMLGAAHFFQEHWNQAENHLRRYFYEHPAASQAALLLARVNVQQQRPADAIKVLEQCLDASDSPQPKISELLATLYQQQGQDENSLKTLHTAAEADPDSAMLQEMLGIALIRGEDRDAGLDALRKAAELDSKPRRADAALILAHLETRNYEAALDAALRYRNKQPDNAEAYNFIGASLTGMERTQEAREAFEKALELDPDYHPAAMNLGNLHHREGQRSEARRIFENIQQSEPGHVDSARQLATMEMEEGRIEAALEWLDSALQANPQSLDLAIMLARAHMRAGDEAQVLRTLSDALERHPQRLKAYYAHANALLALQRPGDAVRVLTKAEQVEPDSAEVQRRLASAHEQAGDLEAMVRHTRKAVALDAEHVPSRIQLAMGLARTGDVDAARQQWRDLRNEHAGRADVHAMNGWFALREGDLRKGIEEYQRALAQRLHRPWLMELVRARQNANDQAGAVADLQRWLEDAPHDTRARHMLAVREIALGEEDAAISNLERLLEQQANNVPALNNLAWLLRERDSDRALGLVTRARELAPDSGVLLDTHGVVLFYKQKLAESARILARAAEQSPDDPAVHFHLGRTRHALGDVDGARRALRRALEGEASFSGVEEARHLYQELTR